MATLRQNTAKRAAARRISPPATQVGSDITKGTNVAGVNVDESRLRVNPRRAEELYQSQVAQRAQNQLLNPPGIPTQTYQGVPQFASMEDAQQAARDYYTRYGTSYPAIDAAIYRMENPDYVGPEQQRSGEDVMAGIQSRATGSTNVLGAPTTRISGKANVPAQIKSIDDKIKELSSTGLRKFGAGAGDVGGWMETPQQRESELSALQQQRQSLLTQAQTETEIKREQQTGSMTQQDFGQKPSVKSSIKKQSALLSLPESLRNAFAPSFDLNDERAKRSETLYGEQKSSLDTDSAVSQQIFEEGKEALKTGLVRQLEVEAERKALINEELKKNKEQALNDLALDQVRGEQLLRDKKIEDELQNRRVAAKMGINFDTGGLQWMQEQSRKATESLAYFIQKGGLESSKIAQDFAMDLKKIDFESQGRYDQAFSDYQSGVQSLTKDRLLDEKEIRKERRTIRESYYKSLDDLDKEKGDSIKEARLKHLERMDKEDENKRNKEKDAWGQLEWAVGAYGKDIPFGILESIQKDLPSVDISTVLDSPTLEQLRMLKAKGGGGGGVVGSYDTSATPQGNAFSSITPNQLREAVDRVTLNFGGTGPERNRKRNEYLGRINSGESTASIMTSMQADYWASQKGAPRTAHDSRTEAQGSAEALESYVGIYGITPEDDGVLGQIDSRKEGFYSIFGQSSEEYNNLANQVGNIRARIIKENYGAAVTPQELALAKSYIPDMTDKGGIFITKLQNLKSYNAYLDAKVFASSVGLPAPTPPEPVTLSGTGMTGTAKYSYDDILSVLSE